MKYIIIFSSLLAAASASSIAFYAAAPVFRTSPYLYGSHSSSLVTPTQQQYHSQDELGQYAYGYSEPLSSKREVHSLDGITRGSYSYLDAEGKLQTVDYTADSNGFHVAATNLPRAVQPLPAFHPQETTNFASAIPIDSAPTASIDSASTVSIASISAAGASTIPVPADTIEVTAARDAHFAAHREAKLRLAKSDSASLESSAVIASGGSVELHQPVQDTIEVAAARADHLKRHEQEKLRNEMLSESEIIATPAAAIIHAASLPLAYQSPVIPSVYSYSYPLNSRFLAKSFYY